MAKNNDSMETKKDNRYVIEVKNLKQYFPIKAGLMQKVVGHVKAVDDISFRIERGKTMGLVGESGSGKTTVGKTMLRLNEATSGKVLFNGQDVFAANRSELRALRPKMQMIFQDPYSSLSPRMPISEIIGEAVREHNIVPPSEFEDHLEKVMLQCGLQPYHKDRYPHEFSGGQRQRICVARSLALNPEFVVCDEPVSALDVSIQAQIINLLEELQKSNGIAYLFISHDLSVVQHISDYVGVMYLGDLVEYSDKKSLFANPLHPYTQALLSAVPVPDPNFKMNRIILEGSIPSPANPPKGCKFHTRCPYVMDVCKTVVPQTREIEPGHMVVCHLYDEQGTLVDEKSEKAI
ncbi:MAG: oligopeptide/dipeptide ABC transporter ATP-binding protein [Anaerolineaceae bacterium]|jgi:peptide/nickel transport system ATP-binding protein